MVDDGIKTSAVRAYIALDATSRYFISLSNNNLKKKFTLQFNKPNAISQGADMGQTYIPS